MQNTRQWRISSIVLSVFVFLALSLGVSAGPAWALDDEGVQSQSTNLAAAAVDADSSDAALLQGQPDPSQAVEPANASGDASVQAAVESAPESGSPEVSDVPAAPGESDDPNITDDSTDGNDSGEASLDADAPGTNGEGEASGAGDGTEPGDNPVDSADGEDAAGETPGDAVVESPNDADAATDANSADVQTDALAGTEESLEDSPETDADSATAPEEDAADEKANEVDKPGSKISLGTEESSVEKSASRTLPSVGNVLKARGRVIWALTNGKTIVDLTPFKLKFTREHDCGETAWYIAENALAHLGYTGKWSYADPYKSGLYQLTRISFSRLKQPSQAFLNGLDDMLSWVPESATDVYRAKAVHDWLVHNCVYSNEGNSLGRNAFYNTYGFDPYTAESALVYGETVCQGYSSAFMLGMAKLGIPCEMVGSNTHAWNRVYIDGSWYNVDVTWDDSGSTDKYFMKSDSYFYSILDHPTSNTDGIVKRPSTKSSFNYTGWTTYRGSYYHPYVWDFEFVTNACRMGANGFKQLAVRATDGNGTIPFQDVQWWSTNRSIAVVTMAGYVVPCWKHGKVKIVCSVNGVKRTCTVWVVGGSVKPSSVKKSLSASAFWHDGKKHVPTVTVRESTTNGNITLRKGTDYTITYLNAKGNKVSSSQIKKIGTYYVLVRGKGLYSGSVKLKFQVIKPTIAYKAHVENIGWQYYKKNGASAGTSGQGLRVEAIKIRFSGKPSATGSVQYRTHVQNIGWESKWRKNGATTGTTGKGLRLEAIQIKLTGNLAKQYDVYYRTHVQNKGWLGWAKNGQKAGSAGYGYRMEAIQVVLVKKGYRAPGSTRNAYAYNR